MATYEVTSPTGQKFEITAPDGATEEQVTAFAKAQFAKQSAPSGLDWGAIETVMAEGRDWNKGYEQREARKKELRKHYLGTGGFHRGLIDPAVGLTQLGANVLYDDPAINKKIAESEELYQLERAESPEYAPYTVQTPQGMQLAHGRSQPSESFDVRRTAGTTLSPVNLAVASKMKPAASLLGKAMQGGAFGGFIGAQQPVTEADYWPEKKRQIATGALFGAGVPLVTSPIAGMLSPKVAPAVHKLRAEGVKTTPGQTLGGQAKVIEDRLTSVPGTGYAIEQARKRGYEGFNRAAINRALAPIKKKLPEDMDTPRALEYARKQLGDAYDDVLGKMTGTIDDKFVSDFNTVANSAEANLPDNLYRLFKKKLQYVSKTRVSQDGKITGENLKRIQEDLRKSAEKYSVSGDAFQRELGESFDDALGAFNSMVARSNPKLAPKLKQVNKGYANFKVTQRAGASIGAEESLFTPAQLLSAVKAADKTKGRAFSERKALMQDLADAGKAVLSSKTGSSGTAERSLMTNPITGGFSALATSPLRLMYGPKGAQVASALIADRPQFARELAGFLRGAPPFLTPAASRDYRLDR